MQEYRIHRLPDDAGAYPLSGIFDPDYLIAPYDALPEAPIAVYPWSNGYEPKAAVRIGWNQKGLHVLAYAQEETIRADVTQIGGRVCEDSCLEFFFQPFPRDDLRYLNFESNPNAVLHIGLGEGRPARQHFYELPQGMTVQHSEYAGKWWAVSYTVPSSFIAACFNGRELSPGLYMKGNLYKCDESVHPHFGCYFPITAPKPDFHRPECFGPMMLE